MITNVIFDLDGVLADCKDLHVCALNCAISEIAPGYEIASDEENQYNALTTKQKLLKLIDEKGLSTSLTQAIWFKKQSQTIINIEHYIKEDKELRSLFLKLKGMGIKIGVATNAHSDFVNKCLSILSIYDLIDCIISNDHVVNPKPSPEIYYKCMIALGANSKNTLIIEDSSVGKYAATLTGATVYDVGCRHDVSFEKIKPYLNDTEVPYFNSRLNILVPMAGSGSRFATAGYTKPKPLIDVEDEPMILKAVKSLNIVGNYIFIIRSDDAKLHHLDSILKIICPGSKIIILDERTEGAACTTLVAKDVINNDSPLLIMNCDQIIEWNSWELSKFLDGNPIADGAILCFNDNDPKWSYVQIDSGAITKTAEKQVISNVATTGHYFWRHGSDYVDAAESMIRKNKRVNNEFYICPTFNEAISKGLSFKPIFVEKMYGLGTPNDLEQYLNRTIRCV